MLLLHIYEVKFPDKVIDDYDGCPPQILWGLSLPHTIARTCTSCVEHGSGLPQGATSELYYSIGNGPEFLFQHYTLFTRFPTQCSKIKGAPFRTQQSMRVSKYNRSGNPTHPPVRISPLILCLLRLSPPPVYSTSLSYSSRCPRTITLKWCYLCDPHCMRVRVNSTWKKKMMSWRIHLGFDCFCGPKLRGRIGRSSWRSSGLRPPILRQSRLCMMWVLLSCLFSLGFWLSMSIDMYPERSSGPRHPPYQFRPDYDATPSG